MNSEVFKPVRGTEASILSQTPQKGYVYFALDTKKIFYSDGESFLPMGGNTGVWYGKMIYAETPDESQKEFDFVPDQIEGNEDVTDGKYNIPNKDDLIFNTPDGCFYRVQEVDGTGTAPILHCLKLTVAGGGGSGGGGGSTGSGSMVIARLGSDVINTLKGNSCFIKFTYSALDAAGQETGQGQASLQVNGALKTTFAVSQGYNEFDVSPYLEGSTNNIRLAVSGNIGGTGTVTQTKNWTIFSTDLSLVWNHKETNIASGEYFVFDWTVSTSLNHTAHIEIDNGMYSLEIPSTNANLNKTYSVKRADYGLIHGSHLVRMYLTAEINGTLFTSPSVSNRIICVDADNGDTIISINAPKNEVNQYDTLPISIILYDPTSENGKVSAILREDGVQVDSWEDYDNGVQYYWNYTPTVSGTKILTILSGTTEEKLNIAVNDLGLTISEILGYDFKFKASEIISNNALRNWSFNNVQPIFSENFDWINGGLKTELDDKGQVRNYIGIKAGSSLSFNYKPFENISKTTGFTIKLIFKANECRKYDADIISIGDPAQNNVYLKLTANSGVYKTTNSTLTVPYCEDQYIEFEIDLWPYEANGIKHYLMTWLDGVPASISLYDASDNFIQGSAKNIVIGSNDCDVQLYMIKVYQKHLSNDQHLQNFIADAPNATEMISRFNRNDIMDENGKEISYLKLIEKNPNCDVYLYDIPRMTKNKKDAVEGCSYRRYHGKTNPEQTAENVTIAVQGTSSAAYGLAAYNIDSEFTEGFTDYSNSTIGEHIDNWAMTEKSMPVNYFNTKVNVASCEQVNNALNQEWYDRYVPYVTEYHAKCAADENISYMPRNTMEFINMGVMFVQDHNTMTNATEGIDNNLFNDTPGYVSNPYYKLYSICNMGNSKKNKNVFTDSNNPYDVIMEVSDNQQPEQWMTQLNAEDRTLSIPSGEDDKEFTITVDGSKIVLFEWRNAPKSNMKAEANQAWLNLVNWFATNNPAAATDEELPTEETYTPYTFKGYTSRADRIDKKGNPMPAYTPEYQILKGKTISDYAGTYTHDTYERRMAKMLSECEEYLIMDAMVFHFLFIERHTLIDNVAKNTFWHTEDLKHWSMIKDYDNDTSDGNDNSGHLTLTYGYEVLDHVNHNENESMVFNASPSVWLHFIEGLLKARTEVYNALDTVVTDRDTSSVHGAWKALPYLEKFNEWQSSLPERVWIENFYRLYIRPWEVYGDSSFLPRLEGGKKTHQRNQYETYQQYYMASEYHGSESKASKIDIRANGRGVSAHRFPMTMYADSYIRIAPGSGDDAIVRVRARRGETYNIQLPVDDTNDMTTYFYLANYITSLGNIAALKPKVVNASAAYRLREFSIGSLEQDYLNEGLTDVDLTNNRMLERFEAQHCPNIRTPLDLKNATNLQYLDLRGSGFTGITIAPNAPVHTLYLNNPTALQMTNLSKITTFEMEYDRLTTLYLDNIDNNLAINSKTLVTNALETSSEKTVKLTNYSLQNVKWTILDSNEIVNNQIILLEKLLEEDMIPQSIDGNHDRVDKSLALVGTLNITTSAYNSNQSQEIYNRYAIANETKFSNLDINFAGDEAKLYNVSIMNGDDIEIWKRKASKNYTITTEFLSGGPMGAFVPAAAVNKMRTAGVVYTFNNKWRIFNAVTNELIDEINVTESNLNPLYNSQLNSDIKIVPIFTEEVRQYTITFMNDNEIISQDSYDYNTPINSIIPAITPRKDDSNLDVYETYAFLGYALVKTAKNPLVFTEDFKVNNDITYYAIFSDAIDTNDSRNVHYENFVFTPMSYTDAGDSSFSIADGYTVSPKSGITLVGKVTLPSYYNNKPVIAVGDFRNQTDILGIYFENNSQVRVLTSNSFQNLEDLVYFEMPDSLRVISSFVFLNNKHLKLIPRGSSKTETTYQIGGSNIYSLGAEAFNNSLDGACSELIIPGSLTKCGEEALKNFNDASSLNTIIIGSEEERSHLELIESQTSHYIRMNSGTPPLRVIQIYVPLGSSISDVNEWLDPYYESDGQVTIQIINN